VGGFVEEGLDAGGGGHGVGGELDCAKLTNSKLDKPNLKAMPENPIQDDMQPFLQEGAAKAAALLRAVGNANRLMVLCLLIEHEELPVSALLERVPLSQSALSQHLARMRDEGLVTFRREAQTLYYRIDSPDVARLIATLKDIFCP
jgi:DNA-binding transcriptional ArsR family regulator